MTARKKSVYFGLLFAVAVVLCLQLFVPPVIGLANNNDFRRTIGTFGYGPSEKGVTWNFVAHDYVPDPAFRISGYEILTSEYLFVAPVIWFAQLLHVYRIPITAFGFVHCIAFLVVLARLLYVTRNSRACYLIWSMAAFILTDVAYVAYWNSAYSEPASCLFFLWLLAESIEISESHILSIGSILRWSAAAILFLLGKPQNAPLGLVLAVFLVGCSRWANSFPTRLLSYFVAASLCATVVLSYQNVPQGAKRDTTYNLLFRSLLPESRHPREDLQTLGLDPNLVRVKGTGAWDPHSGLLELSVSNELDAKLSPTDIARFYALRPTRLWRHVTTLLPAAFSVRPSDLGNYERSAGHPALTRSYAVAIWSELHQHTPAWLARILIIGLAVFPVAALASRARVPVYNRSWFDLAILLSTCCLLAFLSAAFGDSNEPVKHQYLFNLLLDSCFVFGLSFTLSSYIKASPPRLP